MPMSAAAALPLPLRRAGSRIEAPPARVPCDWDRDRRTYTRTYKRGSLGAAQRMCGEAVRTRVPAVDVAPIPPIEGRRGRWRRRYAAGCGGEFLVPMLMPVHPPILPCLVCDRVLCLPIASCPSLPCPALPTHTHTHTHLPTHTHNEPSTPSLSLLCSPVHPLASIRALLSFPISRISFTLCPICIRTRVVHHFAFAPPMAVFFGLSLF
ncbi:hypothetical protein HETIRDRAFT_440212, partial [Heterobasidion irregulare TC 32-1]